MLRSMTVSAGCSRPATANPRAESCCNLISALAHSQQQQSVGAPSRCSLFASTSPRVPFTSSSRQVRSGANAASSCQSTSFRMARRATGPSRKRSPHKTHLQSVQSCQAVRRAALVEADAGQVDRPLYWDLCVRQSSQQGGVHAAAEQHQYSCRAQRLGWRLCATLSWAIQAEAR